MSLKPQNLIQAAEADLERRLHNQHFVPYEAYAFHMKHLPKLECRPEDQLRKMCSEDDIEIMVRGMLLLALMDYSVRDDREGREHRWGKVRSAKKTTKAIYEDAATIIEALRILGE